MLLVDQFLRRAICRRYCRPALLLSLAASAIWFGPPPAAAQPDFEAEPINYNTAPADNPVERLKRKIDSGELQLSYDQPRGYLTTILKQLDVPASSQMLVFSKTSFQFPLINPRRPRAVYFNDDVYVGWVQRGEVMEISTADPQLGAVFYTVSQAESERPEIIRDRGECLACHASSRTAGVPGHLARSVFPSRSGQPFLGSGTFNIDHRSPLEQRWGGWYVTGTHGKQRHMGNVYAASRESAEQLDVEAGANVTDLNDLLNTTPYLSPHSDIVALMVLEHQVRMHNLITRAGFEARAAAHYDGVMNKALDRPSDYRSDSAKRRIDSAAEELVRYMLFSGEPRLTDQIRGTSNFAVEFTERGPRDSQGRSLRDLDLKTRLMKHPCSYLIYSEPFDQLPAEAKVRVYERLINVLTGKEKGEAFAHLATADRQAIVEILRETKPEIAAYLPE